MLWFFVACTQKKKADLLIHHAKMYTCDTAFRIASTIVVKDGRIIAIGDDTLLQHYQAKKIIDAKGECIYPGFIDAHCHYTGYAMDKYKLKLFGTTSYKEVVQKVMAYAKSSKHTWIEGTGWDQNDWSVKSFPTKDTLDVLFPNRPLFLLRVDGHAALVNEEALRLCDIQPGQKIAGGEIETKEGKLTGILIDNAIDIVRKKLPLLSKEESIASFQEVQNDFFAHGLTSIVECGVKPEIIDWMRDAYQQNLLTLRTTFMLLAEYANEKQLQKPILQTPYLHVAGFKIFADGALGSRGAFLQEAYSDRAHHVGSMLLSVDSVDVIASKIIASNYQLCTHAIGDATNHEVLKIYGKHLVGINDRRWRIEHAQVLLANDFDMFKKYSIIPSVQPTHAMSDMAWVQSRIGFKRLSYAYAYKTLVAQNDWMPLGTDFPVEEINPLHTFCAAVFRMNKNGIPTNGFQIHEALSRKQALLGMTYWAAKSVFEEKVKGSLEVGKYADFVRMPTDLMQADVKEIYATKVTSTYVNGHCVYAATKE